MFNINTVSIYVFGLLLLGRFHERHYVAYSVFYIVGTVLCLNIPFVNFQAVTSSEHMASHGGEETSVVLVYSECSTSVLRV